MAQVSDNGSILPRKLTGVQMKKQKRIARAIKRAQNLALMPKIWKLPQYRRAHPPLPPALAPLSLHLPAPHAVPRTSTKPSSSCADARLAGCPQSRDNAQP